METFCFEIDRGHYNTSVSSAFKQTLTLFNAEESKKALNGMSHNKSLNGPNRIAV